MQQVDTEEKGPEEKDDEGDKEEDKKEDDQEKSKSRCVEQCISWQSWDDYHTCVNVINSLQTRNKRQGGETKEQIEEQEWREGERSGRWVNLHFPFEKMYRWGWQLFCGKNTLVNRSTVFNHKGKPRVEFNISCLRTEKRTYQYHQ